MALCAVLISFCIQTIINRNNPIQHEKFCNAQSKPPGGDNAQNIYFSQNLSGYLLVLFYFLFINIFISLHHTASKYFYPYICLFSIFFYEDYVFACIGVL